MSLFPLFQMLQFLIILYVFYICLAFAQNEDQFIYNGFLQAKLQLDGTAEIQSNGLLQLTNTKNVSLGQVGHAFFKFPLKFNTTSSSGITPSLSFSTNFVFVIVPLVPTVGAHGIAFAISATRNFSHAGGNQYLGIFSSSNNGLPANHILAIELDTVLNPEFGDIDKNHVGIDVNSLNSTESVPAMYFSNKDEKNISLELISGNPMHLWIDYDEADKLLNVTLAPTKIPKPNRPLMSKPIDLSRYLLESMYVGFSATSGTLAPSNHYVLGWSFNKSGQAQSLDVSRLPQPPRLRKKRESPGLMIILLLIAVALLVITIIGAAYNSWRKKYEEILEDWEREYGPHRFSYKNLYKATKGFSDKELLGAGVKKVSHDSKQGIKEFVAEIISMGRLRHRNLVQLLGYCRRKGELLLVYDYMPNGSLDKFLYSNEKSNLNWFQRFRILRGVASGLLYLHEDWEQVVIHRDVKASNVLLDSELNGRLGDFGLARLYDHGTNPQTTHVVGTVGYLAPEFTRTGKATTCTDVFAFGAFMLEVACGRRPIELQRLHEEEILIDWVFECWRKGAIIGASDPRLEGNYVVEEMELVLKLGLLCSHSMPEARPSMRQVMQFLDGDAKLPELTNDSECFGKSTSNEASDFFMSFPSSFSITSAATCSSIDSILRSGR
uniref:non-specific serine/threonine protein kinase n=1 Tax=Fagus sylvatica TaxID=28930 RepID=A0A2N9H4I3_FAGSY